MIETPFFISLTNAVFDDIFVDSRAHFKMSLWSASAPDKTGISKHKSEFLTKYQFLGRRVLMIDCITGNIDPLLTVNTILTELK